MGQQQRKDERAAGIAYHCDGARHSKYRMDVLQALALIEWHLAYAPEALADAWIERVGRGVVGLQ